MKQLLCILLSLLLAFSAFSCMPEIEPGEPGVNHSSTDSKNANSNQFEPYTHLDVLTSIRDFLENAGYDSHIEFETKPKQSNGNQSYIGSCIGGLLILGMLEHDGVLQNVSVTTPMYNTNKGALYTTAEEFGKAMSIVCFTAVAFLPQDQKEAALEAISSGLRQNSNGGYSSQYNDGEWSYTFNSNRMIMECIV